MLFSSIPFLYYFLPAVLLIYFAVPKGAKNAVLLLSSLIFYGWGEPVYILLMLFSIADCELRLEELREEAVLRGALCR